MTLSEKVFAMHDVDQKGSVVPGELIRVHVDWVIASEASWSGMERTYDDLGKPGIFRNDRFWLAGDHVVDPRINKLPKVQGLIDASERAKRVFKMTDYQGMNYTILHTEFYRERAQPGMLIVGSDSHTCSSGAVGCLAIGLGAADVTLPLVTGETWFKVPESVNIHLVGSPKPGIGGKDVILYILQQLKRNTVASDRIVEFTGPGIRHLSSDARFAISNMTTEFGGITGVFVPDEITHSFVQKRRLARHKSLTTYFRPDGDALYAATHEIDLGNVRSFLARYPKPDDVVPVTSHEGMQLDGCFIGACTTAEEDLILGALVLEQGMKKGFKPITKGKRKVVPGSMPILRRLRELGLLNIYESAGFEIGIPGCSYCVGMSVDQAAPGEVWLSSQNRNFENRMGKGSIGHLGSAATVAASSFGMRLTDPHNLIDGIDRDYWDGLRGAHRTTVHIHAAKGLAYVEPTASLNPNPSRNIKDEREVQENGLTKQKASNSPDQLSGKVQRLEDFIDTDALAPAAFLVGMPNNQAAGEHCLEFTHPEFRSRVRDGFDVVVAGNGFGCGSSREQAVMALMGCGVRFVIAKSFAFIFQRNMPNLGLLGITMKDESFFEVAQDGVAISIDFKSKTLDVGGKQFEFQLSQMERELFNHGGIASAFRNFGTKLFEVMTANKGLGGINEEVKGPYSELEW
ncbi:aconitase family protein [Penicillium alfredii]|uniref:Aconitase family protein n=1 Tax=Penicillium alfredii TaxID=1506179 RepID=A0A9W9FLN1_9EURO|nr:aconitase family protein [Penicillium alfredii]KAJ5102439.1 aconitase family protein [Penicillium alfredii]